jgi:YD repeat-containing protein
VAVRSDGLEARGKKLTGAQLVSSAISQKAEACREAAQASTLRFPPVQKTCKFLPFGASPSEAPYEDLTNMSDRDSARQSFVYDAFISYRHVDRDLKWAEWLIDALERYRVPKALQKRGLPKRLRKIFRDQNEFSASADINDQVKEALATSRFLIVICSAFTPRSRWVNREIEIFNELGRGDQVLALLTEGEPDEAFPAQMLERYRQAIGPDGGVHAVREHIEPLAADVRPQPGISKARQKRLALIRLVAPILGVAFDDLQQRERERRRAQRLTWTSMAAVFILLAAGSGLAYWELMKPKTGYYDRMVWRWGIPEGLGRLDEIARSHESESYRFVTHDGKVVDARREASGGALKENDLGEAHWVVSYRANGRVERISIFDGSDTLIREEYLEREPFSNSLIISFKRDNVDFARPNKWIYASDGMTSKADITRKELTLNEQGYAIKVRYQNNYGVPQHDTSGSYGENNTYSPEGLILRVAWVGQDGEEITLKNGVRANTFNYDAKHNLEQTTLIGSDNKPFDGSDGYAYYRFEYDSWGNAIANKYYSAAGLPVLNEGSWKITYTYDDHGNTKERAYYGVDGKLTLNLDGYAISRAKFDDRGNMLEEAFFGLDGKPVLNRLGVAKKGYVYDSRDRPIEMTFFGLRGERTFGAYAYAGQQQEFDSQGNIVEARYLGTHSEPIFHRDLKVAKVKYSYNARRQRIAESYFDIDDHPVLSSSGMASIALIYDERGNLIEGAYFGVDGKPKVGDINCARVRNSVDKSGMVTNQECLNAEGNLAVSSNGYAHLKYTYDDRGNITKLAILGADSNPILLDGIAGMLTEYDSHGNGVEVAFFGADGSPITNSKGIARKRFTYNAYSQVIRTDYFGLESDPALETIGCATETQKFDDRGRVVETTCLSREGKTTNRREGYARETTVYDARSNVVEVARFDADGKPATSSASGVWKMTYTYDSRNNQVGAIYFDELGREIPVDVVFSIVTSGLTAQRIGLLPGDRILSYDGKKPTSEEQLQSLLTDFSGRISRFLIVRRGAQIFTFQVAPGSLGASFEVVRAEVNVMDIAHRPKN